MTKPDPKEEKRQRGPKFRRNVLPSDFQIRRPASPMADILNEAERRTTEKDPIETPLTRSTVTADSADTAEFTVTADSTVTEQLPPSSPQNAVTANSAVTAKIAHPEQYYSVPNELDDKIMPTLRPSEQVVLRRIYRLSRGFKQATCQVSVPKLASGCNISPKKTGEALNVLEERGLIKRIDASNRGKKNHLRGLTIECLLPAIVTAKSAVTAKNAESAKFSVTAGNADNKEKLLKENLKREMASPDVKNCPDCQGSGFWYPEGVEKGVAKCKHVRLGREGD